MEQFREDPSGAALSDAPMYQGMRAMLAEGRCQDAARQLGHWPTISGPVVLGDQRGRDLGYPTANLAFGEQMIPRYGIYAAWVNGLEGPPV